MSVKNPEEARKLMRRIMAEPCKLVFGLDNIIRWTTLALFTKIPRDGERGKEEAQAPVLFVGVPGVGKSAVTQYLPCTINAKRQLYVGRPDTLPSDFTGGEELDRATGRRFVRKGPIFCHVFMLDELNRCNARAQSPLLSALEGGHVPMNRTNPETGHIESIRMPLYPISDDKDEKRMFFTLFANMNPIESAGTLEVSEALRERFTFFLIMGYPNREAEKMIRYKNVRGKRIEMIMNLGEVLDIADMILEVETPDSVDEYIQRLMENSRPGGSYTDPVTGEMLKSSRRFAGAELKHLVDEYVQYGLSPRRNFHIEAAARTHAFFMGRDIITIDDVRAAAMVTFPHCIILEPWAKHAKITSHKIVKRMLRWTQTV